MVAYSPTCYPWKSPTRRFPVLVDGGKHVTGVDEIIHHLKSKVRHLIFLADIYP